MTYVGKILVIVIMVFALFFLAVSTVVFSTAKNWKEETAKLKKNVGDLQTKVRDAGNEVTQRKAELEQAKVEAKKQADTLTGRIRDLEQQLETRTKETTEQRTAMATALETAKQAQAEAAARKSETDNLRTDISAVRKQADEYKIRQSELLDQIRILSRQLDTAKANNADLLDRVNLLSGVVRNAGLSDDVRNIKARQVPPDVEGEILRVDAQNRRVEISIGSDDGLVVGHELEIFRMKPSPEYIGKVRIESVEPDKAAGVVVGKTLYGKKIQEGDIVSPKIRPRS